VNFPLQFHVKDQWHYLDVVHPIVPSSVADRCLIARLIAYKCMNFRGAIAHGKPSECHFSNELMLETTYAKSERCV
jgi:hypothetical protein